jgi:hypothetical protein
MADLIPLYLNLEETSTLLLCVEMMLQLDSSVLLHPDIQRLAEEQIKEREGVAGVARADRTLAAARERVPVLNSLRTALTEQKWALERYQPKEAEDEHP